MAIEREVAGLRCSEVLTDLSDFLDGDMQIERRSQIEAHLKGCDVCARFGGAFTAAIQALREEGPGLIGEETLVFERLHDRLMNAANRDLS